MAVDTTLTIPQGQWLQLTNADATNITFQVKKGTIDLVVTVGAVEPTSFDRAVTYKMGEGEVNMPLTGLSPGGGAVTRVYAHCSAEIGRIRFSG